jgi:hypothetical protein
MFKKIIVVVVLILLLSLFSGCRELDNETFIGKSIKYTFNNVYPKSYLQTLLVKKEPLEKIKVSWPNGQNCQENNNCLSGFCLPAEKKCAPADVTYYLNSGEQTMPGEYITRNSHNINTHSDNHYENIISISNWIDDNIICNSCILNDKNKGSKTAESMVAPQGKLAKGCTDFGTVFVTFARAKGYPTIFVDTYNISYLNELNLGNCNLPISGHVFTNIYLDGEWKVYDPVAKRFMDPLYSDRCATGCYFNGENDNELYLVINKGLDLWDISFRNRYEANEDIKDRYCS